MNTLRNSVRLIGNLGNTPEVRTLENGQKLVRLSLATNDFHKDEEGKKVKETQWHNLVIWGRLAGIAEKYLQKGSEVAIEGKIQSRNYLDKEGNKRLLYEINVTELVMLGKKIHAE